MDYYIRLLQKMREEMRSWVTDICQDCDDLTEFHLHEDAKEVSRAIAQLQARLQDLQERRDRIK